MSDQGTEGLLSPFLRNKRFLETLPYIEGRILDYGCGTGGLASFVSSENYVGFDVDQNIVLRARALHPDHSFVSVQPEKKQCFDTVVSLAVIEHVLIPVDFLSTLLLYLREDKNARIIITTPHPFFRMIHDIGARIGLFSKQASEEHHSFLNKIDLIQAGEKAGVYMIMYKRFLLGANQMAVFAIK